MVAGAVISSANGSVGKDDCLVLEGMQIETTGNASGYSVYLSHSFNSQISGNIVRSTNTADNVVGVYARYSGRTHVYNNIIYNFNTTGSSGLNAVYIGGHKNNRYFNNTLYNNYYGIYAPPGDSWEAIYLVNNLIIDSTFEDISGTGAPSISITPTNNATTDSTISTLLWGVGNIANFGSAAVVFVDAPNGNFNLTPGSPAIDAGVDLSADGDIPLTKDSKGATRTAPYDMGAVEF